MSKLLVMGSDGLIRDRSRTPDKTLTPQELERFNYFRDQFFARYRVWPDEIMLETNASDHHLVTYIHCVAFIKEDETEVHTRDIFKITLPINLGADRKASRTH